MAEKADYFQQKNLNPGDNLRILLNSLETRQSRFKSMNATEALALLNDLDTVYEQLDTLEAGGMALESERGRFRTIKGEVRKNMKRVLKAIGGATALVEHRPKPAPDRDERWWWYINQAVVDQQRQLLRRVATILIVLFLVLGGIYVALQTVLAPSPDVLARFAAENDSFAAFEQGNLEDALVALETGLAIVPEDGGLWMMKGVYQELLGQDEAATQSFEQAQSMINDPLAFHIGRGQTYLRTGQPEKAQIDGVAATELDESAAAAWLVLGQSYEMQDKRGEAIAAYEKASEIAEAKGDSEIIVMARMSLGRMMSSIGP